MEKRKIKVGNIYKPNKDCGLYGVYKYCQLVKKFRIHYRDLKHPRTELRLAFFNEVNPKKHFIHYETLSPYDIKTYYTPLSKLERVLLIGDKK